MEKELIALKKKLYDLADIEGDVWEPINAWEKEFNLFVSRNESKYGVCVDEFENIQALNEGKFPKDSFRGRIDTYKKLFEKIKSKE